jgi:enoyl-[acyl-carrier protein] reductase II
MILGSDGVQIGSRFAATIEASSHDNLKKKITELNEGDTQLTLKELAPVRMVKNKFYNTLENLYESGRNKDVLTETLGRARAKLGMFEGNLEEGELEIGQVSALIDKILPVEKVFENLLVEFNAADHSKF